MTAATLSLGTDGKWRAAHGGETISESHNKAYVVAACGVRRNAAAIRLGVTGCQEVETDRGTVMISSPAAAASPAKFSIDERFDFLLQAVNMVCSRTSPSLVVSGEGGLGKTHTVLEGLENNAMLDTYDQVGTIDELMSYTIVKGYSSPKALFRTLFENRHRLTVFDDCDSVLKNDTALNILKAALDSSDKRIITWNAENFGEGQDLPRSFRFEGGVIFITNKSMDDLDQAIHSRALTVDLSMTQAEKIDRMATIVRSPKFEPTIAMQFKLEALAFLDSIKDDVKKLNMRTLIRTTKIRAQGGDWKRFAEYMLTN